MYPNACSPPLPPPHSDQAVIQNSNASLSTATNGNIYKVSFLDVNDNVDHSAIAFGDYHHLEGRPVMSFAVNVIGIQKAARAAGRPTCKQYHLSYVNSSGWYRSAQRNIVQSG
jgi:hypothetical protein